MRKPFFFTVILVLIFFSLPGKTKNKIRYEKQPEDAVLKELESEREQLQTKQREASAQIREQLKKEESLAMFSDLDGVNPPLALTEFRALFHQPPQAQYATNTCWSFAATSYYESEIFRLTQRKMKLSEMWTVYWEYVEKVKGFIATRGDSYVGEGSESNAVNRIWKSHGIVPFEVFPGKTSPSGRFDHTFLFREVEAFLSYLRQNELWDEEAGIAQLKAILNRHIGTPPGKFVYEGKEFSPLSFLEYTGLQLNDYVEVMSTLRFPFYGYHEFLAPDNWWHSRDYLNLPLEEWYGVVKEAVRKGYTVCIGGDVSEPGKLGASDVCFIPTFDIPFSLIDQQSREFRIANETTSDDHGIHLVGYTRKGGFDWFLIKDSGRSARWGKFEGYYFFREDYLRLKMLTYTVHRDLLREILKNVQAADGKNSN
jgi:bleomycin hydrolase